MAASGDGGRRSDAEIASRRRLEPRTCVAVALFALASAARRLTDFDLPWNLASGRVIAEAHAVPRVDALAYTHAPLKYVEPVGDLALFAIDRVFGPAGLEIVGALACAALAVALLRATRGGGDAGIAVVSVALAAMATWLLVRPQLFTFAFLAVELALIEAHREAPDRRGARRGLASIVPLQALWANVHGAAPLGALVIVAYAAHRALAARIGARWPSLFPAGEGARARETVSIAALAVLATCLNPAGPRLLLLGARAGEDFAGIAEWQSPTLDFFLTDEPLVVVTLLVALASMTFARDPRSQGRALPAFDLALALAAIAFATRAVRMAPVAALVLAYVAGRRDLTARVGAVALRRVAWALALAPGAVVALRTESRGLGFAPDHYPDRAVAWIERARPRGAMWNFMPFGGWLAYRLYPEHRVFMDGRNALARDASLVRLARESNEDARALATIASDFDVQWAVSDGSPRFGFGAPLAEDPARWAMVEMDDVAAVYVRRDGPNASLVAGGYALVTHLTPPGVVLDAALSGGPRAAAVAHDGALAAQQDPASPRAAFLDACGAIATRDAGRFARAGARVTDATLTSALREAWGRVASK